MAWSAAGLVPALIADEPAVLSVAHGALSISNGDTLEPAAIKELPTISFGGCEPGLYTIMLVDPDAPRPDGPIYACWMHHLRVNVPDSELNGGTPVVEYVPSAPGKDSGAHRYVWLLFRQSAPIDASALEHIKVNSGFPPRRSFSVPTFAATHALQPVAGVFYKASYDASCDQTHAIVKGEQVPL